MGHSISWDQMSVREQTPCRPSTSQFAPAFTHDEGEGAYVSRVRLPGPQQTCNTARGRGSSCPQRPPLSAVQHVREATAEPHFARGTVVPRFDRLTQHVSAPAAKTVDFLAQPYSSVRHELVFAIGPE